MVIQNSVMDIYNYRIYSCLAFRIQRASRCPEFTDVLFHTVFFIIPPLHEVAWLGVYWFHRARLPVCGQNRVRCVSFTVPAALISYLHILSTNFRCVVQWVSWKISKFDFGNFFKFAPFALSCVHVMWKVKIWFLIRVVIAATFDIPWCYHKMVY